jgi:hypothetical protein
MGRAEIAQEMEAAENNLIRYKMRIKDKNERERQEAKDLEEKLKNPKGAKTKKVYELNLEPDYWKSRFIYPYALDPVPLKQPGQKGSANGLTLDGYNFNMSTVLATGIASS